MATTMLSYKGVCASIRVDGKDLPVYAAEKDAHKGTATCFIASEAGKAFSICLKDDDSGRPRRWALDCRLYFDGSQVPAQERLLRKNRACCKISTLITSATSERPLIFARIETTDNESSLTDAIPSDPGSIRISIQRVVVSNRSRPPLATDNIAYGSQVAGNGIVHEKSKKGGGNKTSLGPTRSIPTVSLVYVKDYSPADAEPFVNFIFRHRPAAVLKAADIIPRTPLPPAAPEGPNQEGYEDEDAEDMKARLRELTQREEKFEAERIALEKERERLKRKRGNVKNEEDGLQPHKFFRPGEVIDLTNL
ncbi:hypothetical protein FRC03_001158 [Tulasnella sp. 419]|nr:hypothetical protein FRC03_001158 [Tulasnella sp. 419]